MKPLLMPYRDQGRSAWGRLPEVTPQQLSAALDGGELLLYYQPKVSVSDRTYLVRWQEPERLQGGSLLLPCSIWVPLVSVRQRSMG